jgi:hypothetical protein
MRRHSLVRHNRKSLESDITSRPSKRPKIYVDLRSAPLYVFITGKFLTFIELHGLLLFR